MLPEHIQSYVGHTPTSATGEGTFFDDIWSYGSGVVDSIGEGLSNLTEGVTDYYTNPQNYLPETPTRADNYGNPVTTPQGATSQQGTQPSGSLPLGLSKKHVLFGVGGIAALALLAKVLK